MTAPRGVTNVILDLIAGLLFFVYLGLVIALVVKLLSGGLPEVRDWLNDNFTWTDWLFLVVSAPFVYWRMRRGIRRA